MSTRCPPTKSWLKRAKHDRARSWPSVRWRHQREDRSRSMYSILTNIVRYCRYKRKSLNIRWSIWVKCPRAGILAFKCRKRTALKPTYLGPILSKCFVLGGKIKVCYATIFFSLWPIIENHLIRTQKGPENRQFSKPLKIVKNSLSFKQSTPPISLQILKALWTSLSKTVSHAPKVNF